VGNSLWKRLWTCPKTDYDDDGDDDDDDDDDDVHVTCVVFSVRPCITPMNGNQQITLHIKTLYYPTDAQIYNS
jgi:hypothetical protein